MSDTMVAGINPGTGGTAATVTVTTPVQRTGEPKIVFKSIVNGRESTTSLSEGKGVTQIQALSLHLDFQYLKNVIYDIRNYEGELGRGFRESVVLTPTFGDVSVTFKNRRLQEIRQRVDFEDTYEDRGRGFIDFNLKVNPDKTVEAKVHASYRYLSDLGEIAGRALAKGFMDRPIHIDIVIDHGMPVSLKKISRPKAN